MTLVVLLIGAAAAAAVTLGLLGLSQVWRRHDAALWHSLLVLVGMASLVFAPPAMHLPAVVSPHLAAGASLVVGVPSREMERWIGFATWTYVAGLGWQLTRLVVGIAFVTRLRRLADAPIEGWSERVAALPLELIDKCRLHRRVQAPLVAGWLHPVIILPESAVDWPSDRLRAILLHEYAHVVRRDYLWNLCSAVHQAV